MYSLLGRNQWGAGSVLAWRHLTALVCYLNCVSAAVAQEPAADGRLLDVVKDKIVSFVVAGADAYSVCEQVDRANKPSYIARIIAPSEIPTSPGAIVARYFVVQKDSDTRVVDFALYRVRFASDREAMRALGSIRSGKAGTVADGKVLTKYAVQMDGNDLYIVRTTSVLDAPIQSFLESFAKE